MSREHFDRRKGKDFLSKCITHAAMTGWLLLLSTSLIFHYARPDKQGDRQWKVGETTTWNTQASEYMLYLCLAGLAVALMGIFINTLRNRRKRDYIHVNLVILALSSIAGIVIYLANF